MTTALLILVLPACAANLKKETAKVWDDYVEAANTRARGYGSAGHHFLWADEAPERAAQVQRGEIVVAAVGPEVPKQVPSGLIHHWIGAVFIAKTTLDRALPVLRDYGRYKDFYQPGVIASKPLVLGGAEDRFSLLLAGKSPFRKSTFEGDYRSSQVQVDAQRRYTVAQTTRIQEIAEYGTPNQRILPEDEGTGLIWRLFSVTRFEERDGGVYVEIEAIVLSRDIPASLSWLVKPIVRRVAKASLATTLQQTREAVRLHASAPTPMAIRR